MILYSAKASAVHVMHLSAIEQYARCSGLDVFGPYYGLQAVRAVMGTRFQVIFAQSTGFANLLVLPLARLMGIPIVYYLHEPTPLRRKLRENGLLKSLVWHAVQEIDCIVSSVVMVSRQELADLALQCFLGARGKITLAPLLLPEYRNEISALRNRVTYLGRIDDRRYFGRFLECSGVLSRLGFKPTILTGSPAALAAYDIPEFVEVFAERDFSEALKSQLLNETICLWNPKRGEIAQSGVTADAIRHGVTVLLTEKDPYFQQLYRLGTALDYNEEEKLGFSGLTRVDPRKVQEVCWEIFSGLHGQEAFNSRYRETLIVR